MGYGYFHDYINRIQMHTPLDDVKAAHLVHALQKLDVLVHRRDYQEDGEDEIVRVHYAFCILALQ